MSCRDPRSFSLDHEGHVNINCWLAVQSACPTPIGLHPRGELPPKALKLMLPSPESHTSPRLHFGSMDAKSIAALEAAFGQDFVSDHLGEKANKVGTKFLVDLLKTPFASRLVNIHWTMHKTG